MSYCSGGHLKKDSLETAIDLFIDIYSEYPQHITHNPLEKKITAFYSYEFIYTTFLIHYMKFKGKKYFLFYIHVF